MSIETMKLALATLEKLNKDGWILADFEDDVYASMDALRAAIEQAEKQEPVAFYVYKPTPPRGNLGRVIDGDLPWVYDLDPSSGFSARMLVYTAPPQREWQGLTDEEIWDTEGYSETTIFYRFARAIEAKLKEKNT